MKAKGIVWAACLVVLAVVAVSCSSNSSSGPEVQSGAGQSCTRTADCESGLLCVANVCGGSSQGSDASAPPEAGGGAVAEGGEDAAPVESGTRLGDIGEACQSNRDCAAGLDCVPTSSGAGVCDVVSYGVTASGKTCSGECSTAADCCDLPTGLGLSGQTDAGLFVSVLNCQDILTVLLGGNASVCSGRPPSGSSADTGCFYYNAYCNCAANTWACNGGKCAYTAPCQVNPPGAYGGCPPFTRTRTLLNTTCNATSGKCLSASSGCSADADCDGKPVNDEVGATCRGGDCACNGGVCYLKCSKNLDCANGTSCDATSHLCTVTPCANDGDCFSQLGKARAQCKNGVCGIPCKVDLDCSPSGDLAGQPFNGTVCGPNGVCAPVGCASDADCSSTTGPRLFCVAPPGPGVHSAISN